MAYCGPLGLPHSVFLTWDDDDRDKAVAYTRAMHHICKGCGTRPEEWEANPNAYIGDIYKCEGCVRLEGERENAAESTEKGLHVRLLPEKVALARNESGEGLKL